MSSILRLCSRRAFNCSTICSIRTSIAEIKAELPTTSRPSASRKREASSNPRGRAAGRRTAQPRGQPQGTGGHKPKRGYPTPRHIFFIHRQRLKHTLIGKFLEDTKNDIK